MFMLNILCLSLTSSKFDKSRFYRTKNIGRIEGNCLVNINMLFHAIQFVNNLNIVLTYHKIILPDTKLSFIAFMRDI